MFNPFKILKRKVSEKLTIYNAMKYLITKVAIEDFVNIYTMSYSVVQLHSLYPDVQAYTISLKHFIDKQPNDKYIANYDIINTVEEVPIKRWFMVNGVYTDPVITIKQFLLIVEEYLSLVEHYSDLQDISYIQSKNLLAYKVVTSNLYTLLEELTNIKR